MLNFETQRIGEPFVGCVKRCACLRPHAVHFQSRAPAHHRLLLRASPRRWRELERRRADAEARAGRMAARADEAEEKLAARLVVGTTSPGGYGSSDSGSASQSSFTSWSPSEAWL